MKKIAFACLSLLLITGISCKDAKKGQDGGAVELEAAPSEKFSLVTDSTKVSFTAYKTTEKLPVGGKFTKINITNTTEGATAMEALNGTTFNIPVSSLFTNDATGTRDPKILEFFFGVMDNTELISGVFKVEGEDNCSIDVTLNGKTANIPLDHEMSGDNSYSFSGVMNLENWDALNAVASINKACEVLHTGKDGVSKTWSEVAVHADVLLQEK
ncbi:YceI family protein [Arenibacter algicola]|uniref:YceI family protein n=1 Tax=Arenibacter algicola TaxID=616991 RepID=UPI0004DF053B|nr:YceI family protein [Arenibacter algicola]